MIHVPLLFMTLVAATGTTGIVFQPSMYHGEEFALADGTECIGLFDENGQFALRTVTIRVETVEDGIVDPAEGPFTGKLVSVAGDAQPYYLFSGVRGLKLGAVEGELFARGFIYPGEEHFLPEGDGYVRIRAFGRAEEWHGRVALREYRIEAQRESQKDPARQELFRADELDGDGRPSLVWSGDLDGDGKTDLLMNLTDHYNVSVLTLFLSSMAEPGELAGLAAKLVTTGC